MKNNKESSPRIRFPWHVILFSLYPSLALWAHNVGEVNISVTYRGIGISLLLGVILLIVLWIGLRDWSRAGIAATLILILFFSYGHIYSRIEDAEVLSLVVGRHRFLGLLWLILSVVTVWWIARKLMVVANVSAALNAMMSLLLLFPLYNLIGYGYVTWRADAVSASSENSPIGLTAGVNLTPDAAPDVYYIILDGYGRSDVLLRELKFDNSAFISDLEKIGFYIAQCSQSNYGMTALSLSSSLNMDYISALGDEFTPDNTDRYSPLWELIKNSTVEATFKRMGYQVVAFETGYDWTEFRDAEYFFKAPQRGLNSFESLLLRDSAALILDDFGFFDPLHLTPEDQKRNLVLYVLNEMKTIANLPGPKFVFIHLVVPHQPFVFGPNGEPFVVAQRTLNGEEYYSSGDYLLGYENQARFISRQIPELMERIIQGSPTPPVIVIQGDHGPAHLLEAGRMPILNAYYFPQKQDLLYATITPVNSFRLLFDTFFDGDIELLPDVSYFSRYSNPYDFEVIPNQCDSP